MIVTRARTLNSILHHLYEYRYYYSALISDASMGREYSDEDKLDLYLPTAAVTTSAKMIK